MANVTAIQTNQFECGTKYLFTNKSHTPTNTSVIFSVDHFQYSNTNCYIDDGTMETIAMTST